MRIEQSGQNVEIRTKSLYGAAFLMTMGAQFSGIEWLDPQNAEFVFILPDGLNGGEVIKAFYTNARVPIGTYAENHSYLKSLLFQSKKEIRNERQCQPIESSHQQ